MNGDEQGRVRAGEPPYQVAWIILALACVLMACNSDRPAYERGRTSNSGSATVFEGTIVALGDSLSAGLGVDEDETYPALLASKLAADGYHFQVVNAGISGETSSGVRERIHWVLSSLKPDIVILETGANDGLRGQDPGLLKKNLEELLAQLKARNIVVVLAGMRMPPNLGIAYTQAFDRIYPQVAEAHGVIFMPFFLESVVGRPHFNRADKLHPNALGYERIVEDLYPYVLKAIKHYRSKN